MNVSVSIAVLLTCYNRKEKTISCLDNLLKNYMPDGYSFKVFLVDDGSTDGTEDAVRNAYPQINIIKGDGSLFWNGGMRVAFEAAIKNGFDYYLWLNDDTMLNKGAVSNMLSAVGKHKGKDCIVVGSTHASTSKCVTYGGLMKMSKWRPLSFQLIAPSDKSILCDTMNGNCVLIPASVVQKLGNIDASFSHAMGDIDYGLRAKKMGVDIVIAPNFVGECDKNSRKGTHYDGSLGVKERWQKITSRKELPMKAWYILTKRHAGVFWPIYWAWPYVKVLLGKC